MAFQVGGAGSDNSGVVRFTGTLPIDTTGAYSTTFRIKFDTSPTLEGRIFESSDADYRNADSFRVSASDATAVTLFTGKGSGFGSSDSATGVLTAGAWHAVAIVRESTTSIKLYVDGVLILTSAVDVSSRPAHNGVGWGGISSYSVMAGTPSIADIIMWDGIALTAGEVALEVGPDPVKAGATAYFPYRETSARDGNGHSVDQIGSFTPLAAGPEVYTSDTGLPVYVTTISTIGTDGDYASLTAWQAGRKTSSSSGDTERAEVIAGTDPNTGALTINGWTTGVIVEIAAQTAPVTMSGRVAFGTTPGASVTFDGVAFDMAGFTNFQAAVLLNFTQAADFALTIRRTEFVNGPSVGNFVYGFYVSSTHDMGGHALDVVIDNAAWHSSDAATRELFFQPNNGAASLTIRGCSVNGNWFYFNSSGRTTPLTYDISLGGCLFNLTQIFNAAGDATVTSSMVDTISNQASPSFGTETRCLFSKTFSVSGDPASDQVGWTSATDLTLVNHSNNLALNHWSGAPLATDISGGARSNPADAGAYELVLPSSGSGQLSMGYSLGY